MPVLWQLLSSFFSLGRSSFFLNSLVSCEVFSLTIGWYLAEHTPYFNLCRCSLFSLSIFNLIRPRRSCDVTSSVLFIASVEGGFFNSIFDF